MTIRLDSTAEGQPNGTAISTGANTGAGSGDVFAASKTATATLQFSSTQKAHGSIAYFFSFTAAAETAYLQWQPTGETATSYSFRGYIWIAANPAANDQFIASLRNSSANVLSLAVSTTGKLKVLDAVGSTQYTSTTSLTTSTWMRFELQATRGSTTSNGVVKLKFFVGDSTTSVDTEFSSSTMNIGTTDLAGVRFGRASSLSSTWSYYLDDLALQTNSAAYIGPTTASQGGALAASIGVAATGVVAASTDATISVGLGITAAGTVAAGVTNVPGAATLAVGVALAAAGVVGKVSGAAVSVGTGLTAAGSVVAGTSGAATVSSSLTIAAAGRVAATTGATAAVGVAITATGVVAATRSATITPAVTVSASGAVGKAGGAAAAASIDLQAAGTVGTGATADELRLAVALVASGVIGRAASAPLAVGVGILATGVVVAQAIPDTPMARIPGVTVDNRTSTATTTDRTAAVSVLDRTVETS